MTQEIIVDPGFRDLLFKPTAEEYAQLEENILSEGRIRDPLVLWKGHNILLDGHNRWAIYQEHSDELPFPSVTEVECSGRDAAEEWMLMNQLGRRNLTTAQAREYRGRLYKAEKRLIGEHSGNQYSNVECAQSEHIPKSENRTADKLAKQLGVGRETIKRDEKYVDGLDAAKEVDPKFVDDVRYGRLNPTREQISKMATMEPEERIEAIEEIKHPTPKPAPPHQESPRTEQRIVEEKSMSHYGATEVPEYSLGDLIEEIRGLQQDFIEKYHTILDVRRDVATDTEKAKRAVRAEIKNLEKELNEIKEIVK